MNEQNNTFNEFCACLLDDKGAREQTPTWVREQLENGLELSDLLEQIKNVAEEYPHWGLHAVAAIVDLGDDPDSGRYPKIGTPFLKSLNNTRVVW